MMFQDFDLIKIQKKFLSSNKIPFVLMHSISTPEKMQKNIKYKDVLLDIYDFFEKQISLCEKNGISKKPDYNRPWNWFW